MIAFINELSFVGQASDFSQCAALISDLMGIIDIIQPHLENSQIYVSRTLWDEKISPDTKIDDFLYDRRIDNSIRLGFNRIVTDGSYYEEFLDKIEHQCIILPNGTDVTGSCIAAASKLSGILISVRDSGSYNYNPIIVQYKEDADGFQELKIANVLDSSSAENIIAEYIKREITSWDTFWNKRESLFPELVFCDCVKSQLSKVDYHTYYKPIRRHLLCMNDYIGKVRRGVVTIPDYETMGIEATPEYQATLDRYDQDRMFVCPDGEKRLFTWHSKMKGPNKRIHFYPPDSSTNEFYIGYIGKHLLI